MFHDQSLLRVTKIQICSNIPSLLCGQFNKQDTLPGTGRWYWCLIWRFHWHYWRWSVLLYVLGILSQFPVGAYYVEVIVVRRGAVDVGGKLPSYRELVRYLE